MTVRKKEPSVLFILLSLAGFVLFWAMVSDAWGYSDHLSFKNGNYVYAYLVRIVWMLPAVWLILRFRDSLLLSGKELISRPVLNRLFLIMLGATLLLVFSGMLIAHHGLWVNPNINPLLELVKFAIVGIVEETVFRGWGYNALAKATTNKKAIVLSILFFALVHWPAYFIKLYRFGTFDLTGMLQQSAAVVIWGVAWCWLLKKSKTLWNPIIIHVVFDYLTVLFIG